jgi:hypothetical protein
MAQDTIDFGTIAPPVIETPISSEETAPAGEDSPAENNSENTIAPSEMDSVPGPASINFDLKFDEFSTRMRYATLEIVRPSNNSTFDISQANIRIEANVVPPVRRDLGHVLQIRLDDTVIVENETQYMLDDVERGKHRIVVQIIDSDGNIIARTDEIAVLIE